MEFLFTFINLLFNLLTLAILARVLLSWVRINPYNPIIQILDQITEPILAPIRRFMPSAGGLDLSPIIAIVLLRLLQTFIYQLF